MYSFSVFLLLGLIFSITTIPVFADDSGLEMRWHIEGQQSVQEKIPSSKTSSDETTLPQLPSPKISNQDPSITEFVTGNQFLIDGNPIQINSERGQIINQILFEQKEIDEENWIHKIKYWDRYGDGYILLADSLVNPVSEQTFVINGIKYNEYTKSNLEYFLLERGYDPDNPDNIPNSVFNPVKYNDARQIIDAISDSGQGYDLRELSPNYLHLDDDSIQEMMIKDMQEQVSGVFDTITTDSWEQQTILENTGIKDSTENSFDNFEIMNPLYQNTDHVKNILSDDSEIIIFKKDQPLLSTPALVTIFASAAIASIGFVLFKRFSKTPKPQPILQVVDSSESFLDITQNLLKESLSLFQNDSTKEAHEKLSQAIRFYYSQKYSLQKEVTTFEILQQLKQLNSKEYDDVKEWLYLCSMVEFAKQKSHQRKFVNAITRFTEEISKN